MFPKIVVPPNHPILIGFSNINHPFWGFYPYFWKHPNGLVKTHQLPRSSKNHLQRRHLHCSQTFFGPKKEAKVFRGNLAWWTYHSIWPECKVCLNYDLPIACTMRLYLAYMILAILARSWSWCQLLFVPIFIATSGTSWFTLGIFGGKKSPPKMAQGIQLVIGKCWPQEISATYPKTLRSVHMTWCLSFFFWQKWEPRSLEKFPQQLILCYPPKKMCLCQKNKKNTTKMFFSEVHFFRGNVSFRACKQHGFGMACFAKWLQLG